MGPLAAKVVVGLLIAAGIATLLGAALLWPTGQRADIPLPFQNATGGAVTTEAGHVLSSSAAECGNPSAGAVLTAEPPRTPSKDAQCVRTMVAIDSGPNRGATTLLEFSGGPGQPNLTVGDDIRISRQVDDAGATTYAFYDYERTWPLTALAAVFAVV
ncbi:MAG: YibE/F family protein, partial [Mycobacterium sp.]|nr:YibE/F family protein [Mycobacterium sp.]